MKIVFLSTSSVQTFLLRLPEIERRAVCTTGAKFLRNIRCPPGHVPVRLQHGVTAQKFRTCIFTIAKVTVFYIFVVILLSSYGEKENKQQWKEKEQAQRCEVKMGHAAETSLNGAK